MLLTKGDGVADIDLITYWLNCVRLNEWEFCLCIYIIDTEQSSASYMQQANIDHYRCKSEELLFSLESVL